ncbi:MAG: NTP transferase domain-containing protein [Bdellovibrio sp.]
MNEQRIATFLLAADPATLLSGFNKLLHSKQRPSSVRKMAQSILMTKTGPTIVVLGHEAQKVHGELYDLNVEFVLNADYKKGSLSSLQTGLKNYIGAMDAFIVVNADSMSVSPESIRSLATYYKMNPGKMLATFHQTNKGQPVLLSADFAKDILALSKNLDQDVRDVFRKSPQYIHLIEPQRPRYYSQTMDFEFLGHE